MTHLMNVHAVTRRGFLAASLGAMISARLARAVQAAPPPNVLLILSDDLGWNDIGYRNAEVKTPNLDALAASGVRLEQYRSMSTRSPTRAALLTGRSAFRIGVPAPIPMSEALPIKERLLPQMLSAAGYQTALIGKWHLGAIAPEYFPHKRGFDTHYGYMGGETGYFTHRIGNRLDWYLNGQLLEEDGYTTDLLAAAAIRYIRGRDRERPFFLDLSVNAPHIPLEAQEEYLARYAHIEDPERRTILAMIESMDAGIGRVLAALKEEGIAENTLIIWASDNGGQQSGGGSNTPLRGQKGSAFEGGVRVPAIVSWPGILLAGAVHQEFISLLDWLPTLAEVIGFDTGGVELDGVSMWRNLREGATVERGPVILGSGTNTCVFRGDFKFVEQVMGRNTNRLLFRIIDDPTEQRDRITEYPNEADELLQILRAHPRGQADRI
ncbi:MAG: arylsulfatase [Acidobacteria bacterium]|nr:arylsulfatase [Acidobacteriota bacterium]